MKMLINVNTTLVEYSLHAKAPLKQWLSFDLIVVRY